MRGWTAGHRPVSALAAAAVLGSLWGAAACGGADAAKHKTPAGEVAIGPAAGAAVVATYDRKSNAAARARSAPAVLAIEVRPLREISLAGLRIDQAARRAPLTRMELRNPVTYAPRLTRYPYWFVAQALVNGRADQGNLSLYVQRSAGAAWLKSLTVGIGATSIAKVDVDEGGAALPSPTARARVRTMTDALTRYLGTGHADAKLQTKGTAVQRIRADVDHQERTGHGKATFKTDCVNEPANEHALRQVGGTLVLSSIRCTLDMTVLHGGTVTLRGSLTALAANAGHLAGYQLVTEHMVALSVPDAGPALVLGDSNAPVALYGNFSG